MRTIRTFKGNDEYDLNKLIAEYIKEHNVEPVSASGFADIHNYLVAIVIFEPIQQKGFAQGGYVPQEHPEPIIEETVGGKARNIVPQQGASKLCLRCNTLMEWGHTCKVNV